MHRFMKVVIHAVCAALFIAQMAQAGEPAKPTFRVFKNYGEAVAFYKSSGQLPHGGGVFIGYSLEPFGSRDKALAEAIKPWHGYAAYAMAALVLLHVAAALKHQLVDRDGLMARMWPAGR